MKIDRNRFNLLPSTAKRQESLCSQQLYTLLSRGIRSLGNSIKCGRGLDDTVLTNTIRFLSDTKRMLAEAFAVDGWHLAGTLIGLKSYIESVRHKANPQVSFGVDQIIAQRLTTGVDKWLTDTSVLETVFTTSELQCLYREAEKGVIDEETGEYLYQDLDSLAEMFINAGLAWSSERADLLARTITNWSYNEGAKALYKEEGIKQVEWMTTEDDATCEECAGMDGTIIDIDDSFLSAGDFLLGNSGAVAALDIEHPPLHPNCRCTLLPVISYEDILNAGV